MWLTVHAGPTCGKTTFVRTVRDKLPAWALTDTDFHVHRLHPEFFKLQPPHYERMDDPQIAALAHKVLVESVASAYHELAVSRAAVKVLLTNIYGGWYDEGCPIPLRYSVFRISALEMHELTVARGGRPIPYPICQSWVDNWRRADVRPARRVELQRGEFLSDLIPSWL